MLSQIPSNNSMSNSRSNSGSNGSGSGSSTSMITVFNSTKNIKFTGIDSKRY